jgi:threonine dehydrogenase-like Zn-dependent dehydrogenase
MKAACWHGKKHIRVEEVPDPKILNPRDVIVQISSTAICGSDLHLYNGFFPGMKRGDIMGHEFMGTVTAVGSAVKNLKEGDRVVVPCTIACGSCVYCKTKMFSGCDNSNAKPVESATVLGYPGCGMMGYSLLTGSYAGGQADMARVPYADVGPIKVPDGMTDEQVLFLSDILPTGWMGAQYCGVQPGDVVAVWGCGPVGQMAIKSLFLQGAERVIAIDRIPERLQIAARNGAEPFNFEDGSVYDHLLEQTGGRGPDACLDAVGLEAQGSGVMHTIDRMKQAVGIENDRPPVLREMIRCCKKGGTISLLGVYSGMIDTFPMGLAFNKGLTFKMSQVHVQAYYHLLLELIMKGKLDPTDIITHTLPLESVADGYKMFNDKTDGCLKVIMKPGMKAQPQAATVSVRQQQPKIITT